VLLRNNHASLCGDVVVLRPSTAIHAKGNNKIDFDAGNLVKDVTDRIDAIENKPLAALYAGGAVIALVTLNGIVASFESIPLLPKVMELVGVSYSVWFAYRYLLTASSRKELMQDIDEVKAKISE